MTKTLTEQWREGTLPDGYYYIDYDTQQRIFEIEDSCATYQGLPAETYFLNDVCLIKVLAPVPSYDEYKELTQRVGRLELENEVLDDIAKECNKRGLENKKLKEQLKEANGIINYLRPFIQGSNERRKFMAILNYENKWGMK